jgi:hypothetical protein
MNQPQAIYKDKAIFQKQALFQAREIQHRYSLSVEEDRVGEMMCISFDKPHTPLYGVWGKYLGIFLLLPRV